MEEGIEEKNRQLLAALQEDFGLTSEPFEPIAQKLGWSVEEVLTRLESLRESGLIRKFGAVLSPKNLGFVSILAAADIPDDNVDAAAEVINSYRGVTHNYVRDTRPNIWFTLTEVDQETLESNLVEIEKKLDASVIRLPMTHLFKIGVKLDV